MKMNKSWSVPVASFALATALALIAGPKPGAIARDSGGTTGGVGVCVCDVYNLFGSTQVTAKRIAVPLDYDFRHGMPATDTNNTVGYTTTITLKYDVLLADGITVSHRTLEVPLKAKPDHWKHQEVDVVDTKKISVMFTGDHKDLNKAMKAAGAAVAKPEKFLGEDPTGRNPLVFKFHFHGHTYKRGPTKLPECDDDLDHTVPTPINAAGSGIELVEKDN